MAAGNTPTELVFTSGARTAAHAPRFDLVPPELMEAVANRFEVGLLKYSKDNWKKGISDPAFLLERANHVYEHLVKYLQGDFQEDSEEENLAAIGWGVSVLLHALARGYSIHGQTKEAEARSQNTASGF